MNGDPYLLNIEKMQKYKIVTRIVAYWQSFRQECASTRTAREIGNKPNFSGVTETSVRQFVQEMTAINLQNIHDIVEDKRCWSCSIVFDAATNREDGYLDVLLRCAVRGKVDNFYLLAITMNEYYTGMVMFNFI